MTWNAAVPFKVGRRLANARLLQIVHSLISKVRLSLIQYILFNNTGQFRSPKHLTAPTKSSLAQYFAYSEWARIALDVANQYPNGDYFEFGSEGLNTLCNFLAASISMGMIRISPRLGALLLMFLATQRITQA